MVLVQFVSAQKRRIRWFQSVLMALVNNELVLMALVELSSAQKIGSDGVGAIGLG
jgi:hypothetical protein